MTHISVLLKEAVEGLNIQPDGCYIDATFGRGGHSRAILTKLSDKGRLIVIDKDPEAIKAAESLNDKRITIWHRSFDCLNEVAAPNTVNGIMMDLGVSSPQLDNAARGFSFSRPGPLDMRMDPTQGQSAADWLHTAAEEDIANVLWRFGEEKFSRRIARAIVARRKEAPLQTTDDLARVIEVAVPKRRTRKHHPATQSFQAIRIWVNQELQTLETALSQVLDVLLVGGRLCVISFHSLEDRIVKRFMQREANGADIPSGVPLRDAQLHRRLKKVGGLVRPGEIELELNARARSSRLRIAEKIA